MMVLSFTNYTSCNLSDINLKCKLFKDWNNFYNNISGDERQC